MRATGLPRMRPDDALGTSSPLSAVTAAEVLLTGANGFVGSHILGRLRARSMATRIWLRPHSRTELIGGLLAGVEVHRGTWDDAASLDVALRGVTHVIHCAGCTKALRPADFFAANQAATRTLVEAVNRQRDPVRRLVYISSLAASHPALPENPAREEDPSQPVTLYGQSKLAGEKEIRDRCQVPHVILRPAAVYGPGDGEFLKLFRAIRAHLAPRVGGGRQLLSLVYAGDLADAVLVALEHPAAAGKTYHVAFPEVVATADLSREIARQMDTWVLPLPLPDFLWWPICLGQEAIGRLTGTAPILSRQKIPELRAPGWVCCTERLREELGFAARTSLKDGIRQTLEWYRQKGWL
jgi:2-alkyl-3-oxoalkanoate reductase